MGLVGFPCLWHATHAHTIMHATHAHSQLRQLIPFPSPLVLNHARGRRHCETPSKSTKRHNTKTVQAKPSKHNEQHDATKNKKPTVDGRKFATSMTRRTTRSRNKQSTNKQMCQTPVPPKFNVGMRVEESALRSLRVSSDLTLRPFSATQH